MSSRSTQTNRVQVHDLDSAPEGGRAALEHQASRLGRVLNIHGAMANSPTLISLYDLVETHLATNSTLDDATRQAIHLTVAAINDCDYCQAAYTGAAMRAGFSEVETIAIGRGSLPTHPKLDALLRLSRQIADNRGHVDESAWVGAQDAGWSIEEILDGYADVVRTILTNYFNHMVRTELDLRPAP